MSESIPFKNTMISLLLTGASGFVGGTILTQLLKCQDRDRFDITVLIRDEARAQIIREKLGLKTIVADLSETEKIKNAASSADVVIDAANADHAESAAAMISGLARRTDNKQPGIMVHISGTGSLTDNAAGEFAADKVYDDEDLTDYRKIAPTYVHRAADIAVLDDTAGDRVRGYVIAPPLIYGRGTGPFSRTSVQIPAMIRGALKLGQTSYIGKGLPLWNGVHVEDLANLFLFLMDDGLSGGKAPYGKEGLYYCPTDQFQWKQLADAIGQRLYAKNAVKTKESRSLAESEEADVFGAWARFAYASNSRSRLGKVPKLGFQFKHGAGKADGGLFDSIDAEYEAVLIEGVDQKAKVHFDEMYALSGKSTK